MARAGQCQCGAGWSKSRSGSSCATALRMQGWRSRGRAPAGACGGSPHRLLRLLAADHAASRSCTDPKSRCTPNHSQTLSSACFACVQPCMGSSTGEWKGRVGGHGTKVRTTVAWLPAMSLASSARGRETKRSQSSRRRPSPTARSASEMPSSTPSCKPPDHDNRPAP